MKRHKPWSPDQSFLLPPSPRDWLPENHLAYFVLDIIGGLDLGEITRAVQSKDARGQRPYSPGMMLALLVYGYCTGVFSSRRLARATYEDVAFRVLAGGQNPHFTSINDFRHRHLASFKGLFLQILRICQEAGLVKLGHVAPDGTKVQGNASKHKSMSHKRMLKVEQKLREEIDALIQRAGVVDGEEDAHFGVGIDEKAIPEELQRREVRLARIREALEHDAARTRIQQAQKVADSAEELSKTHKSARERSRLATVAKQRRDEIAKLSELLGDDEDDPPAGSVTPDGLETHSVPCVPGGKPTEKAQRNFTDSDSRIMHCAGNFLQGYNCQLAVDDAHQVIVAQAITNQPPDNHHILPMADQVIENCNAAPDKMSADAGYWDPANATGCRQRGIDAYISTRGRKPESGKSGPKPSTNPAKAAMQGKLSTVAGHAVYARRKAIVEPVNGQIKEARGFRRFHLRGLRKVAAEWSLVAATHNLLKLHRALAPSCA